MVTGRAMNYSKWCHEVFLVILQNDQAEWLLAHQIIKVYHKCESVIEKNISRMTLWYQVVCSDDKRVIPRDEYANNGWHSIPHFYLETCLFT